MGKLDGKVAIVTGAARGLGRAYAHRLAALGAKVAVSDLNLKSYAEYAGEAKLMTGDTTADEIVAGGGEALGFEFDIADSDAVNEMADQVARTWGRIDILVANAGGGRGTPKETAASIVPKALLHQVTEMNYYGTVYCCSAVAPFMKAQRSGKIVTAASYAGRMASIGGGYAHYGAAKAAIAHYTRYLAQELGPYNINANCIAPGVIETARIVELVGAGQNDARVSRDIALGRHGTPEDCANVVEFLTTEASDYVTGALIPIDGAWYRGS
jgi:3-oxoacyl-[acyl-carrier protein] reductase